MRAMAIATALIVSTAVIPTFLSADPHKPAGQAQEAAPVEGMKVGADVGFVFSIDLGTADGEAASPARVAAMAGLVEEAPQGAGGAAEEDVPLEEVEAPAEEIDEEVYEEEVYEEEVFDEEAAAEAEPAEPAEAQEQQEEPQVEEPAEGEDAVAEPVVAEAEAPPPA